MESIDETFEMWLLRTALLICRRRFRCVFDVWSAIPFVATIVVGLAVAFIAKTLIRRYGLDVLCGGVVGCGPSHTASATTTISAIMAWCLTRSFWFQQLSNLRHLLVDVCGVRVDVSRWYAEPAYALGVALALSIVQFKLEETSEEKELAETRMHTDDRQSSQKQINHLDMDYRRTQLPFPIPPPVIGFHDSRLTLFHNRQPSGSPTAQRSNSVITISRSSSECDITRPTARNWSAPEDVSNNNNSSKADRAQAHPSQKKMEDLNKNFSKRLHSSYVQGYSALATGGLDNVKLNGVSSQVKKLTPIFSDPPRATREMGRAVSSPKMGGRNTDCVKNKDNIAREILAPIASARTNPRNIGDHVGVTSQWPPNHVNSHARLINPGHGSSDFGNDRRTAVHVAQGKRVNDNNHMGEELHDLVHELSELLPEITNKCAKEDTIPSVRSVNLAENTTPFTTFENSKRILPKSRNNGIDLSQIASHSTFQDVNVTTLLRQPTPLAQEVARPKIALDQATRPYLGSTRQEMPEKSGVESAEIDTQTELGIPEEVWRFMIGRAEGNADAERDTHRGTTESREDGTGGATRKAAEAENNQAEKNSEEPKEMDARRGISAETQTVWPLTRGKHRSPPPPAARRQVRRAAPRKTASPARKKSEASSRSPGRGRPRKRTNSLDDEDESSPRRTKRNRKSSENSANSREESPDPSRSTSKTQKGKGKGGAKSREMK